MIDSFQELLNAEKETEFESLPIPRRQEKIVNHSTIQGKLVYEIIGPRAGSLFYSVSNNFVSAMLQGKFYWWIIEKDLRDALKWCKIKGANPFGYRTVLRKIAAKHKLPEELIKEIK